MDYEKFKYLVYKAAGRSGIREFEVFHQKSDVFRTGVYGGKVDFCDVSTTEGIGFRGLSAGRMGYAYTERLDRVSADMLVEVSKENSSVIDSSDKEFIYKQRDTFKYVDTYNEALSCVTGEKKTGLALGMERNARNLDSRVDRIRSCITASFEEHTHISNSSGLELSFKANGMYAYIIPVLVSGSETRTATAYRTGRDFEGFSAEELAKEAVESASSRFGAKPVATGRYAVLFKNDAAADLMQAFSSIFIADNVHKGLSLLKNKTGERIASCTVDIKDSPLLEEGLCARPFDAEGVASHDREVVTEGILKTLLYNLKTAYRDGVKSTGHASRGSYALKVSTAPSNLFFIPGTRRPGELIEDMTDGIYITELAGLHAGANPVTGDFSLAAKGFLIKSGGIDRPVEQIIVAGNFYEMLTGIVETADDLRFGMPSGSGCFGSPALLVEQLSVAGT